MPSCQAFLKILREAKARSIPLTVLQGCRPAHLCTVHVCLHSIGSPWRCVVIELFFKVQW